MPSRSQAFVLWIVKSVTSYKRPAPFTEYIKGNFSAIFGKVGAHIADRQAFAEMMGVATACCCFIPSTSAKA